MVGLSKHWSGKRGQSLLVVISALVAVELSHEYWAGAGRGGIYLGIVGASVLLVALLTMLAFASDGSRESH